MNTGQYAIDAYDGSDADWKPETPTDPESPIRPRWTPVYMGEGLARRCQHCGQTYWKHDDDYHCLETFLRQHGGDR